MNLIIAGFLPIRHETDLFNLSRQPSGDNELSVIAAALPKSAIQHNLLNILSSFNYILPGMMTNPADSKNRLIFNIGFLSD
ncbi:hypothetical protein V2P20_13345 [Methylobacter sp. Wu1]|uniref:hypothetical protein n=1 Tax=Methylobacter sp. Wu1 TaxID=3119359 RepID=UPI002F95F0E5